MPPISELPLVDLSKNARVPVLMELTESLSRATSPHEVLQAITVAMRKAYGPRCYVSLAVQGLEPGQFRITRWVAADGVERVRPGDPLTAAGESPVQYGGVLSRLIATAEPKLVQGMRVAEDLIVGDSFKPYGSLIAAPVMMEGKVASWTILLHEEPQGLGVADLEQLILRGNLIGSAMNNMVIANRLREATDWIRHEVDHIAQIQRALLPQAPPNIPGLTVASKYETFDKAGGDYYDILPLTVGLGGAHLERHGRWGLMVADASGHGPAAAVVVAMLHAILHAREEGVTEPALCLEDLNTRLFQRRVGSEFVTAFFATYDPSSRRLIYANAGHNPPFLRSRKGVISRLDQAGGIPLGVMNRVDSDQAEVSLEPGSTMVMYTDGITEAADQHGRHFGDQALEAIIAGHRGTPEQLCDAISAAVKRHRGATRARDDQTVVVLHVDEDV